MFLKIKSVPDFVAQPLIARVVGLNRGYFGMQECGRTCQNDTPAALIVKFCGNSNGRPAVKIDRRSFRRRERGVTILLVAIAMMALLAMAALAIDIVTLYVSEGEAQRVADAAALAGAKVFVSSGFTSWQLGDPALSTTQNIVCNGSTGLADLQAQAVASHNRVAGTAPTTVTTSCNF